MTRLDTLQVGLAPTDATKMLAQLHQRNEPWSLQPEAVNADKAVFALWTDDVASCTEITLHANGAWNATAHVLLGKKHSAPGTEENRHE